MMKPQLLLVFIAWSLALHSQSLDSISLDSLEAGVMVEAVVEFIKLN